MYVHVCMYRIVPGKRPWALTAQALKIMEEVFQQLNCPCASTRPRCKVSSQGGPNRPASRLRPCFLKASPMEEKAVSC